MEAVGCRTAARPQAGHSMRFSPFTRASGLNNARPRQSIGLPGPQASPIPPGAASCWQQQPRQQRRRVQLGAAAAVAGAAATTAAASKAAAAAAGAWKFAAISAAGKAAAAAQAAAAPAAPAAPAAASGFAGLLASLWPFPASGAAASSGAAAAASSGLPALLVSLGFFFLSCAGAVFLIAAIPSMWAMAKAARRVEAVLAAVEPELPDTLRAARLAGLEITDCISEITGLGTDLTGGIRSTAKTLAIANNGVQAGVQAVEHVLNKKLVPGLADGEKSARELVEEQLRERAKLKYSAPVLAADTARATTAVVKKLRVGVWAAGAAGGAVRTGMALRGLLTRVAQRHQSRVPCEDDDLF